MAVSSQCQRLGVGQELMKVAIQFSRDHNYEEILLRTSYIQQQAKRFYERCGFEVVSGSLDWEFCVPFYHYYFRYALVESKSS